MKPTAALVVSGLGQSTRAAARLDTTRPPRATRGCPHTGFQKGSHHASRTGAGCSAAMR